MNVLIACEFSAVVRDAFRERGYNAWSCDLLDTEGDPRWHYRREIIGLLDENVRAWDLMIAHPPCTFLCSSGLHWNKRRPDRQGKTEAALVFVKALFDAPIRRIALENPIGCISTRIRKYDQKIQPWQFGHDASKGTCLWLKNLPVLRHTRIIPPKQWSQVVHACDLPLCADCEEEVWCPKHRKHYWECDCIGPTQDGATYKTIEGYDFATLDVPPTRPVWANQTPSGQNKLGPSTHRWAERSRTYSGIAYAMADQWGVQ